nr:hypothetical protein [uncultured Desulfobulbus sp.]
MTPAIFAPWVRWMRGEILTIKQLIGMIISKIAKKQSGFLVPLYLKGIRETLPAGAAICQLGSGYGVEVMNAVLDVWRMEAGVQGACLLSLR